MIDKLVLQIPFSDWMVTGVLESDSDKHNTPFLRAGIFEVPADRLPFKQGARELYRDENGALQADEIYSPWESLATSHGGLAVKAYHKGNGKLAWPYLELKCSPAKLVQAHNVWGTDDPRPCVENMLAVLSEHYPELVTDEGLPLLNMKEARVSEFDITYSVRVPLEAHRLALIDLLRATSKGQTRNRGDAYETTVYYGSKKSRLKKVKIYLKGPEILRDLETRKRKNLVLPPPEVVSAAEKLVRFELTIKKDWLERRRLPTRLIDFLDWLGNDLSEVRKVYNEGMRDLFEALSGEVMNVTDDKDVMMLLEKVHGETRGRVARLMGFYQALKGVGFENLKKQYPPRTFRRYVQDLEACGFGRAHLCALHIIKGNTVVAFPQVVRLDGLGEPAPADYQYPAYKIA